MNIFVDNKGAISLAKNTETSESSKHIDVRCHYVREKLQRGEKQLNYVQSNHNLADIFTKVLSGQKTADTRLVLGLDIC